MAWVASYGIHHPQGLQGFQYAIGEFGTWKKLVDVQYKWNYYDFPAPLPVNHPADKNNLIAFANGTNLATCRDANAHLLLDFDHDGELDQSGGGFAYHEHAGRGVGNKLMGNPFTNFWFDDNSLARFMNLAYNWEEPFGLSTYNDFTRWQIIGGDATHWTPYSNPENYPDQLALNGLFYLAIGNNQRAKSSWEGILKLSKFNYNASSQRYDYPGINEGYHMGLWMILSSFLLPTSFVVSGHQKTTDNDLLQHWVSLRSQILSLQVTDDTTTVNGPFYGWTTDVNGGGSLINTETISTNVLALGAGAVCSVEAGREPATFESENEYFLRPHFVLSAVTGISKPGVMMSVNAKDLGQVKAGSGTCSVDVLLRSSVISDQSFNSTTLAVVSLLDVSEGTVLASVEVTVGSMAASPANQWRIFSVTSVCGGGSHSAVPAVSVKVHWTGAADLDVALARFTSL